MPLGVFLPGCGKLIKLCVLLLLLLHAAVSVAGLASPSSLSSLVEIGILSCSTRILSARVWYVLRVADHDLESQ